MAKTITKVAHDCRLQVQGLIAEFGAEMVIYYAQERARELKFIEQLVE